MTMAQTHDESLRESLDAVQSGLGRRLGHFEQLPHDAAVRALGVLLRFGCQSQHIGNVIAARNVALEVSPHGIEEHLSAAVESLSLDDEWEYRRLLELLRLACPQKLKEYLGFGRVSKNEGIAEIAMDFAFYESQYPRARYLFEVAGYLDHEGGFGLLPGIPQALIRNSSVGAIRPGTRIGIRTPSSEELLGLEMVSFLVNTPLECDENVARNLPLVPVVGVSKENVPVGTEVYAVMS